MINMNIRVNELTLNKWNIFYSSVDTDALDSPPFPLFLWFTASDFIISTASCLHSFTCSFILLSSFTRYVYWMSKLLVHFYYFSFLLIMQSSSSIFIFSFHTWFLPLSITMVPVESSVMYQMVESEQSN